MSHSSVSSASTVLPVQSERGSTFAQPHRLAVRSYGMTDPGQVRPANEDQFLIAVLARALQVQQSSLAKPKVQYSNDRGHLFVVADGMGGHAGGQRASALTIDFLEDFMVDSLRQFMNLRGSEKEEVLVVLKRAVSQADARVCAEARNHPEYHGMGTTVTLAYSLQDELFVVHVGDSRCYLLRERQLQQVTSDHTITQELVRKGMLAASEASSHHLRHVITNAIGGAEQGVQVEFHQRALRSGDCLLLCSDGLTDMLSDAEITSILEAEEDPQRACEALIAAANEKGGRDNITTVVARYVELLS